MDINASGQSADISLPTFGLRLSENDVILLRKRNRRRRFDISIVYAVAARCSFGFPQVLVCRPERKEGSPFPTLFWLTCPYLDRKCGELESLHKIRELEELFSTRPTEVARWHKEYALLRKSISETGIDILTGVGGIDSQEPPRGQMPASSGSHMDWMAIPSSCRLAAKEFGAAECSNGLCGNCDRPPLKPQV